MYCALYVLYKRRLTSPLTKSPKSTCYSAPFIGILCPYRYGNASVVLPSGGSDIGGERQYMW